MLTRPRRMLTCAPIRNSTPRELFLLPTRFARDLLSLLARFGEPDGNRLLAALDLSATAAFAALERATLAAPHGAFDVARRGARIFSCHEISPQLGRLTRPATSALSCAMPC